VVKARQAISWVGVREPGYSGADVSRYLGVINSCVTRLISTGGKQDIDNIDLKLRTFCTNFPYSAVPYSARTGLRRKLLASSEEQTIYLPYFSRRGGIFNGIS
jgi:hypothetical protein